MFIAKTKRGELINLVSQKKEIMTKLAKEAWYCPSCGQPVILKNGSIKQAHFAHLRKSLCQSFSEGETEEHLAGKKLLASWCQSSAIPYKLEAYLPNLKQRPDLLINDRLAIEFQCSHLSLDRLAERTMTYQRYGYQVIWVVGKNFFIGQRLSGIQKACVNYHQNNGFYLWELDVLKERLSCLVHLEEVGSQAVFFTRKSWLSGDAPLLDVLSFPEKGKLVSRRRYNSQSLLLKSLIEIERKLVQREPGILLIQEHLYCQGLHLRELDICFFLPVTQPLLAKDSVCLWRLLVWQIFAKMPQLSFGDLLQAFYQAFKSRGFRCYVMPQVALGTHLKCFLREYLEILRQLGYLTIQGNILSVSHALARYSNVSQRELAALKLLRHYNHISVTPHKNML